MSLMVLQFTTHYFPIAVTCLRVTSRATEKKEGIFWIFPPKKSEKNVRILTLISELYVITIYLFIYSLIHN